MNGKVKFTDTPRNLNLEFTYFSTDSAAHGVGFKIEEIFVILPQEEEVSITRFGNEVFLNLEIIPLIEWVNESQPYQAGSTLLYLCQK